MGNAMVQEQAARPQYPVHGGGISRQVGQPDMLEHADAGDLVVDRFTLQIAIVAQLHSHQMTQAFGNNALLRIVMLLLAQRDAMGVYTIMPRRPAHQRTPAAADIEEMLTGFQAQFAADMIELVALRLFQRVVWRLEVGA